MKKPEEFDFTKGLAELEAITAWFESDKVDLDQALPKFERGLALAAELKTHLAEVENRVEQIKQKFTSAPQSADAGEAEPPELFEE